MDGKGNILLQFHLLLAVIGLAYTSVYPAYLASATSVGGGGDGAGASAGEVVTDKSCIESEKQALLEFKKGLVDNHNLLSSWGGEDNDDCCLWHGVRCHNQTGNIISLDLGGCQPEYHDDYDSAIDDYEDSNYDDDYCLSGKISHSLLNLRHLRHLDLSGQNFFESLPEYTGSLRNLRYLNLSGVSYPANTVIPVQISNLSNLHTLDLGNSVGLQSSSNLGWLSRAYSLRRLDLSFIELLDATDWLHTVAVLPCLSILKMGSCSLPPPKLLPHNNISKSLKHLEFGGSNIKNSVINWLPNITRNPIHLGFSLSGLSGVIPQLFWDFSSLRHLDLSANSLEGGIAIQLGNITSLEYLDLNYNNLDGSIPYQLGNLTSLRYLDLSTNKLQGDIPHLGMLPNLTILSLNENKFTGIVPKVSSSLKELRLRSNRFDSTSSLMESIGLLSNLLTLDISSNPFNSVIVEAHFSNLSALQELYLSNLPLKLSLDWVPPFKLRNLDMASCNLGPKFPQWLLSQNSLSYLDLSNNGISSTIPDWFWKIFNNFSNSYTLDLSHNHLYGTLSNVSSFGESNSLAVINLSFNNLSGPILQNLLTKVTKLDLSSNFFSGPISFLCTKLSENVEFLNLSNNSLSGELPDCWSRWKHMRVLNLADNYFSGNIMKTNLLNVEALDLSSNFFSGSLTILCTKVSVKVIDLDLSNNSYSGQLPDCLSPSLKFLRYLGLADNNFSGNIPKSMGFLPSLSVLDLSKNKFCGELPSSLRFCAELEVLNVMENRLSGNIPVWIGESLRHLLVLSMQSNMLHGNIPQSICNIQSIQILDLSLNSLSGDIPWCLDNFTMMSSERGLYVTNDQIEDVYFNVNPIPGSSEIVDLKGVEREYKNNQGLIKLIDLSSNKLSGGIPHQVTNLVYLISLNLSRNCLSGTIPGTIGNLSSLETLDLSRNQLSGEIPSGLSELSYLDTLNLSYNNLSGRIPLGTQLQGFNSSVYQGNSGLCGAPLASCDEDRVPDFRPDSHSDNQDNEDDELLSLPFYIGATLGFIVGFWGVFGSLMMKRSWRNAYFQWLSRVKNDVYVKIVVGMARVKRRFQ